MYLKILCICGNIPIKFWKYIIANIVQILIETLLVARPEDCGDWIIDFPREKYPDLETKKLVSLRGLESQKKIGPDKN